MNSLLIHDIREQTFLHNRDNIARTLAYNHYFQQNPEIKWSLLAHIVSRNAGWNMTDLELPSFKTILTDPQRKALFLTYESINWFIFRDAYPQLLIYERSKQQGKPLFFLFKYFGISTFMEREWYRFYQTGDQDRLMIAQIINEQQLIQKPIVKHNPYQRKVFQRMPYYLQSILHLNAVVIPTLCGKLYGLFIPPFQRVHNRIKIGKQLAQLLYYPYLHPLFHDFINEVQVTGSREEYEQFMLNGPPHSAPPLRNVYERVEHELSESFSDWSYQTRIKNRWFKEPSLPNIQLFHRDFMRKRHVLFEVGAVASTVKNVVKKR
ncbi:hypothetical protein ABID56_000383 [Alkalibacillus flavidus]|uniref:DUF2515 domain-containing protein n=1 Tax=Alkalibacillus flavidus TaxID=546021 RepID=A0ABV2KRT4_9BACI